MNLFYEISTGAPNAPSIFYQRVREAAARLSRDCVFEAVKVMLSALGASTKPDALKDSSSVNARAASPSRS
jgi:hypothetical protein